MHVHMSISKDGSLLVMNMQAFQKWRCTSSHQARSCIECNHKPIYKLVLVPHFEAPIMLAYSARNRLSVFHTFLALKVSVSKLRPNDEPVLRFRCIVNGWYIQNKIHPGEAADKNLYDQKKKQKSQQLLIA